MDGIKYAVFTDKSIRLLGKNQYTSNVESGSPYFCSYRVALLPNLGSCFGAAEYWKQAIALTPGNYIEAQNWLKITKRFK